ncbi:MAG: hypothetical protein AABZ55_09945, partial [Bdellovibrionota bacterium]
DTIFIIEPLVWAVLGMSLVWQIKSKASRAALALLLATLTFLLFKMNALTLETYLFFLVFLAFAGWFFRLLPEPNRCPIALMLVLGFLGCLKSASIHAKDLIVKTLSASVLNDSIKIRDIALSPAPAQPFCWSFTTSETDLKNNKWITRQGYLTLTPRLILLSNCPQGRWFSSPGELKGGLIVIKKYEAKLETLTQADRNDCEISAWLRFARIPVIDKNSAFDLRFTTNQRINFSKLDLKKSENIQCPSFIPPWEKPRQDILSDLLE